MAPPSFRSQRRAGGRRSTEEAVCVPSRMPGTRSISIPSGFSSVSLYHADQLIDGGQVTDLEHELLQQGAMRALLPELQRQWLLGQHRERTISTFDRLAELAATRCGSPEDSSLPTSSTTARTDRLRTERRASRRLAMLPDDMQHLGRRPGLRGACAGPDQGPSTCSSINQVVATTTIRSSQGARAIRSSCTSRIMAIQIRPRRP